MPTNHKHSVAKKYYGLIIGISMLALAGVAVMPWLGEVGLANPKTANISGLWLNFLGEFHFLFLHLPIGATVLVLSMEVIGLIFRGKYKPDTALALGFAASSSVIAAICGYFLYLTGEYEGPLVEEHKRDGILFTVMVILTFLVKYSYDLKLIPWFKPIYIICLIATGAILISAGHHGGEMTHGSPMRSLPSKVIEKREARGSKEVISDVIIYTHIVHPILDNKCISCHGPDKAKGGLRMDSIEAMFEGGDEEECLVPGNLEASFMITSIMLPIDDDCHMPPENKKQITDDELKILKWWIDIGAPKDVKLSDVDVPEAIDTLIATLLSSGRGK